MIFEVKEEKLTSQNIDEFSKMLEEVVKNNTDVTLDMKNTQYISSVCLRELIMSWKILRIQGNSFKIINTTPIVKEVLIKTGLGELLPDTKTR